MPFQPPPLLEGVTNVFLMFVAWLCFHRLRLDFGIFQQKKNKQLWEVVSCWWALCYLRPQISHTADPGNREDLLFQCWPHCWPMMVTSDPRWPFPQDSRLPLLP